MDAVLPILIEQAGAGRDRLAVAARDAAQAVTQAQATLERLEQFRQETLARAPAMAGRAEGGQVLADWQHFVARLDAAIAHQRTECALRREQHAQRTAALAEGQRRLMAYETLARRRQAQRQHKDNRRAQREADEFAARAFRADARSTTA